MMGVRVGRDGAVAMGVAGIGCWAMGDAVNGSAGSSGSSPIAESSVLVGGGSEVGETDSPSGSCSLGSSGTGSSTAGASVCERLS